MSKGVLHYTNRLKGEKSPYLKQHSENPVDWYPWSDEALERARAEDKPVILSIGYSSCHWCHVMERESFEDPETARIMNENFINIKIDREERPDLDSLYMKAVQAMTGHAGWPLTVFASPGGVPFYGGSYFPPDDRYGLPSFKKVLFAVSLAYKKNKNRVNMIVSDIEEALSSRGVMPIELGSEISETGFDAARLFFDPVNGGFGRGTKFPHAMFLEFLLKYHQRTGSAEALAMVKKTLSAMAAGGIYDHIGGGFHRYSVDEMWDIPHFEKMLYDNALLARLYAFIYRLTGAALYRDVSEETLGYMLREMRSPEGGFYSAEDADAEGREGAYYLWEDGEIKEALGGEKGKRFTDFFPVTAEGNFDGKNMLRINTAAKGAEERLPEDIADMKKALLEVRSTRKAPDKDLKVITGWNGLAVSALAEAAVSFNEKAYLEDAKRCATFILSSLRSGGRLMRYYLDGAADVKANLEDYALFGGSLVSLYEASKDEYWIDGARAMADEMIDIFYDNTEGLFFDTGRDQGRLFVRERDLYDNDIPSGNSAAASYLLRLSGILEKRDYREMAEEIMRSNEGMREEPLSYGNFLCVLEDLLSGGKAASRPH